MCLRISDQNGIEQQSYTELANIGAPEDQSHEDMTGIRGENVTSLDISMLQKRCGKFHVFCAKNNIIELMWLQQHYE